MQIYIYTGEAEELFEIQITENASNELKWKGVSSVNPENILSFCWSFNKKITEIKASFDITHEDILKERLTGLVLNYYEENNADFEDNEEENTDADIVTPYNPDDIRVESTVESIALVFSKINKQLRFK